jgi:hypothetical protein
MDGISGKCRLLRSTGSMMFLITPADMSKGYSRALDGVDVPLPPPAFQYHQYAQQQRQLMKSADGDRLIEYWERQLCGALSFLNAWALLRDQVYIELAMCFGCMYIVHQPTQCTCPSCSCAGELPVIELYNKARPAMHTTRGDVFHFTLPADVSEQLRTIAREEGTTLYTVLAAAFSAFISRSCGGLDDVIIGTPVSCRNTHQVGLHHALNRHWLFSSPFIGRMCRY